MSGVVKAVKKVVKTVVNVVKTVVKAVVNFVGDAIGFVINPFGSFDAPQTPDPGAEAQGVTVTKSGTNVPIPLVYGHRRVGGIVQFAESNGTSNKYLYVVYALCEGEIHGVNKIIVDDVELPTPTTGNVFTNEQIIDVTEGRFKDRIRFQCFNGSDTQPQSTLANETPTWPKKSRKNPGIAYVVMRFEWAEVKTQEDADKNPFNGGIPNVKFDVFGKKVYDVRTHVGGADLVGSYASRTKVYSFNPANCLLDYLENPRYGAKLKTSKINADTFKIAANKYEQTVQYSNTQNGRALMMNAVIDTGQRVLDNVKYLVAGSRGIMPFVQGRYKLKVEDGGHPTDITSSTVTVTYDVDARELVGTISMDGERKNTKYNQVIVNYIDPDLGFSNQQVVYNQSGDQVIDNDELLSGEFTFHTVTNRAIAYDLAALIYKKSRNQRQISFTATQELLDAEVGDVVRVTNTVLDLDLDTFRIVGMKLRNDGNIDIDAVEHDATIYPFTSGPQIDIPPPLYIPDEFNIIPVVKPLPQNPVQLVPIVDPDAPDSGAGGGVVETPNPVPPSWDQPPVGITAFQDYTQKGRGWDGVERYYFDKPSVQAIEDQFGFDVSETATQSLISFVGRSTQIYSIFNTAYNSGTQYNLKLNAPTDPTIDELVVDAYEDGAFIDTTVYRFRVDGPLWYNPNTKTSDRADYRSGILTPYNLYWRPRNYSASTRYKVRWRKSASRISYQDGSDFSGVGFSNYTYIDHTGVEKTRGNLEGFLNYLHILWHDSSTTTNAVSTNYNLGEA